ncbi:ferredoxin--NADP reductase [Pseudoalteromonas tunicata]|uniref:ferredoxin--NADP reductase n=1 Tax=Pseudoalteromonas tunicata TaxID=314281 RepID=UPI00273E9DF5|nr:ferredoxin--NADP reductase [Pseudoalteromonas tunicata]MDP4983425.1 ferredoxin--NADP reductase [Pseudoalteromonas tunicata]MDP5212594.1 ferredoxin--NADP reductase [Pseudoalteromonas tunicata]
MANWKTATVKEIVWWNKRLFSLIVQAQIEPFKAGQFTKLALETEGNRIARAYSFVNPPSHADLEFYLINVEDGLLSPPLGQLKAGDQLQIASQASGFFTLDEVPAAEQLWLLATGTAIGPFLSILQNEEVWDKFKTIHLVHGVRKKEDLSYRDLINQLMERHSQLKYVSLLSQEENLDGLNGRITTALEQKSLEQYFAVQATPNNSQFMICGNPAMVKESCQILLNQGFRRNRRSEPGQITVEQYW